MNVLKKEIQSVEVSCFVHSTEDVGKVATAIAKQLHISLEPLSERLEGHFGNLVLHLRYHLTDEEAWVAFRVMVKGMERDSQRELLESLESSIDEHSALFLRFSKQDLVRGKFVLSTGDPVRVRVKPRGFMKRGEAAAFYTRLLESGD